MKRLPILLLFLCSIGWALPASDNFDSYSNDYLHIAGSANWTNISTGLDITSGEVSAASSGAESACYWHSDAFDDDQTSGVLLSKSSASYIGTAVRCNTSGVKSYYAYYASSTARRRLIKVVAGSTTTISQTNFGTGASAGSTLDLTVEGTTLTAELDDSEDSISPQTDASLSSGAAGLAGQGFGGQAVTSWTANNLGGAAPIVPILISQFRRYRGY